MTRTERTARIRQILADDAAAARARARQVVNFRARGAIDPRVMALAKRNGHGALLVGAMSPEQKAQSAAAWAARKAA